LPSPAWSSVSPTTTKLPSDEIEHEHVTTGRRGTELIVVSALLVIAVLTALILLAFAGRSWSSQRRRRVCQLPDVTDSSAAADRFTFVAT